MQITKPELARQQLVMKFLKFYKHKIDGIWGPESIAAKQAWESQRSFIPAYPNQGMPFGARDTLPKGVSFNPKTRIMECVGMSETVIAEIMALQEPKSNTVTPVAVENKVEAPVPVPTPTPDAAENSTTEQQQQPAPNPNQHQKHQHNPNHHQKRN